MNNFNRIFNNFNKLIQTDNTLTMFIKKTKPLAMKQGALKIKLFLVEKINNAVKSI